jgi:hypothetical protein
VLSVERCDVAMLRSVYEGNSEDVLACDGERRKYNLPVR